MLHLFLDGKKIFLLCFPLFLWGNGIAFTNYTEEIIPNYKSVTEKQYYKIFATSYIYKISKRNFKSFLFNHHSYMLKNNVYSNGFLKTEKSYLSYQKAYLLNNKLHLFAVKGHIDNKTIEAKELIYNRVKSYVLKHCQIKYKSKILRRKIYHLNE
jgi:uncharacterized protein YlaI